MQSCAVWDKLFRTKSKGASDSQSAGRRESGKQSVSGGREGIRKTISPCTERGIRQAISERKKGGDRQGINQSVQRRRSNHAISLHQEGEQSMMPQSRFCRLFYYKLTLLSTCCTHWKKLRMIKLALPRGNCWLRPCVSVSSKSV